MSLPHGLVSAGATMKTRLSQTVSDRDIAARAAPVRAANTLLRAVHHAARARVTRISEARYLGACGEVAINSLLLVLQLVECFGEIHQQIR